MATEEVSQDVDRHHEDHEWEAQRANFTRYYKDQNMTLKAATKCMITNHNFHATPRQWERKIATWNLQKYTSRQARLEQIAAQGKTVHEVANASRRPRAYDDKLLRPDESNGDQRNIRRFARRELSRSRSRSRSNSFGRRSRASSIASGLDLGQDEEVIDDQTFNLNFDNLGSSSMNETSVPAVRTTQDSSSPQAHVLHTRHVVTGEINTEVLLAIPDELETFSNPQSFDGTTMSNDNFGYQNMDPHFVPNNMVSQNDTIDPFPDLDPLSSSFATQQDHRMQDMMSDTTPFLSQLSGTGWDSQASFGDQSSSNQQMFQQNQVGTTPQIFNSTSADPIAPHRFSVDLGNYGPSAVPVPQILLTDGGNTDFSGTSNLPQTQTNPAITLSVDEAVYADFNTTVMDYTQAIYDKVMATIGSAPNPQQLSHELQLERNIFIQNLNITLTNFAHTQQRALQSMRDKCKVLKTRNDLLQQQLITYSQMPSQSPIPSPGQSPSGHRYSVPSNYGYHTSRATKY